MDVLIKNFDMPENCEECPLANDECFGAWKCSYVKQWGGKKTSRRLSFIDFAFTWRFD